MRNRFLPATLLLVLLVAALPPLALAEPADSPLTGAIDSPAANANVAAGQPFTINGWVVDRSAQSGTGVDAIAISLQQPNTSIDLGSARLAQSRPDVAAALDNPSWATAGYALDAPGVPAGTYTLNVNAHTASGWISRSTSVNIGTRNTDDGSTWTAYGYNVVAPSSMWPMLELLHRTHMDWELASAGQRPTPIVWADLPSGVYGQYQRTANVIRLSKTLQGTNLEARTAFLAHELTHLTDDLNGRLGDMTGDLCFSAETRAFVNEANFWQMVVGSEGKANPDAIESQENTKMFAFVGNSHFADLVLRTTASYVKQCGTSH